jgi:hypothetical protein
MRGEEERRAERARMGGASTTIQHEDLDVTITT